MAKVVAKSMAFRTAGTTLVVRHADAAPSPEDWSAFIEAFTTTPTTKVLMWSSGVATLNAEQRESAVEAFRTKGDAFRGALVTSSRIARGAATAISWFGPRIRGFGLADLAKAVMFLEVSDTEGGEIRKVVDELGREVGDETAVR